MESKDVDGSRVDADHLQERPAGGASFGHAGSRLHQLVAREGGLQCESLPLPGSPHWGSEPATFTRKEESGRRAIGWLPEDTASTTREHGSLWSSDH